MYLPRLILLFLFSSVSTTFYAQSPWINPKGSSYWSWSNYVVTPTNVLTDGFGSRYLNREVFEVTTSIYSEYSVADKFAVYANIPFRYVSSASSLADTTGALFEDIRMPPDTVLSSGSLAGFGNIEMGVKYGILTDKRLKLAMFADISLQSGRFDEETFLLTAVPATELRLGLAVGGSGEKWYSYGNAAFSYRTNNYSARVHAWAEFGRRFGKVFTLGVFTNAKLSVMNTGDIVPFSEDNRVHTGFYINNQDYVAFGLKTNFKLAERWELGLSLGGAFFARNLQQAPAIGMNVSYNLRKDSEG